MPYTHRVGRKPPCERHVTIGAPAAVSTAAASLVHCVHVHSARHAAHLPSLRRIVCPDSARRTQARMLTSHDIASCGSRCTRIAQSPACGGPRAAAARLRQPIAASYRAALRLQDAAGAAASAS